MSGAKVEITEPDPSATSLPIDQTVKKEGGDSAAPTKSDDSVAEVETKETNGASKDKEEDTTEDITEGKGKEENGGTKPRGQNNYTRKNNSKYDPSVLENSDDPRMIRNQVEFYFGDANLPTDKHMWELTDGSANLPVSISELHKFGRMKRFQPYSAIVAALRQSNTLEVTGPEGQEQVKRKVPYDPTMPKSKVEARSIYVKGFGDEENSSQFDIEAFFAPYGPTNAVRLRRTEDKLFKGSVFVEFQDEETAQKFLELEPKPLWKGKQELTISSKRAYMNAKEQDIKDGKMEPAETWAPRGRGGRGRGGRGRGRGDRGRNDRDRSGRDRDDRDPDDWKKRREEDRASGFKGDSRRDDRDRKGGRGGKRGGRRGGRDDKGPRDRDEHDGETQSKDVKQEDSAVKTEDFAAPAVNDKKRAREDDEGGNEGPAKKVDTKAEVPATEAS